MPNSSNVTTGKPAVGGAIFVGATTDTLPTSTTGATTSFTCLGYISADGVTNSNTISSNDVKAWGGTTVLNTQTDKPDTFKFKLLEILNEDVLKEVYGSDNVTTDSSTEEITIKANAKELSDRSWIIDMIMRNGVKKRITIPCGKISSLADIVYKDDDATGYEVTITAQPDTNGNTHYEYIK